MMRSLLLCFLITILLACTTEPPGVPIGFSTELRLRKENRIQMTERDYKIFTSILQADPKTHFSGKKYLAFDTIYTSTQRNTSDDPAQLLKNDSEVIVYAIQNEDFSSAFYSRKGWFIYRTYIPEPAYKQTVIIDIAGSDSAMIAGYFYSGETKKIIK